VTPTAKFDVPAPVTVEREYVPQGALIENSVSGYPAVQPHRRDLVLRRRRTLWERFFTRPWRPLHHVHVRRWEGVYWDDIEGTEDGLELTIHPARRPSISYEVDLEELVLDVGMVLVGVSGAWYAHAVWGPWMANLLSLLP
jgi:hypothetical protein